MIHHQHVTSFGIDKTSLFSIWLFFKPRKPCKEPPFLAPKSRSQGVKNGPRHRVLGAFLLYSNPPETVGRWSSMVQRSEKKPIVLDGKSMKIFSSNPCVFLHLRPKAVICRMEMWQQMTWNYHDFSYLNGHDFIGRKVFYAPVTVLDCSRYPSNKFILGVIWYIFLQKQWLIDHFL